ncbi:hypothetical protein QD460_14345 [Rhizobium jaguaris]|uniref:hypothetical protein n=1 Tax=Rhizobium jaguaris TaxID=1312183 RepID=UPI0039BFEDFA
MLRFALPILFVIAGISPAVCEDAGQATTAADIESMKDFMHANPDCQQFTDQCSICAVVDGKAQCSTPQIACVKKAYQCTIPPSQ